MLATESNSRPAISWFAIVLAGLSIASAGCFAQAATYYVRTDGNNSNTGTAPDAGSAWATINYAATRPLSPGDVIYIKAGTYTEQIAPTVDGTSGSPIRFIADRDGTISGWSSGQIKVMPPTGHRGLYISGDNYLEFHGFHFIGSTSQAVLLYPGTGIRLENCDITSGAAGIYSYNCSSTLVNLLIHDCTSIGLYCYGTSVADVWNCTIVNSYNDGVRNHNTSAMTLTNCIIANNRLGGIRIYSGTVNHTNNLVYGNGTDYYGTTQGTGEINSEPYFVSSSDYRLQAISPAIDAGTSASGVVDDDLDGESRPHNGNWDLGCYEKNTNFTAYYVRPDGDNANAGQGSTASEAWATVEYAAQQSLSPGAVVYVQAGTYAGTIAPNVDGTSTRPIRFLGDSFGLVPGWSPGSVILQADSGDKVLDIDNDDYLEFEGFVLAGDPGDETVDIDASQGVVVSRCEVYGGDTGIEVDQGASVTIVNCLCRNNAGKGMRLIDGVVEVWNCTIVANGSDGVEVNAGKASIVNCIIFGNGDAGIDHNGGSLEHTYNLIADNAIDYEGTSAATGEISVDPRFAGNSDYHLVYGSPAIDAGSAATEANDDLDGKSRPVNGNYDIGCYEASGFYFVRTDGDDSNPGTGPNADAAWATIGQAAKSLSPGDTVYVKAGTYNEYVAPTVVGDISAPIRFVADNLGTISDWGAGDVTIQAPSGQRAIFLQRNYVEFHGFRLIADTLVVYLYNASGIRIENCEITNTSSHAFYCYSAESTLVNILIHDCGGIGLYSFGDSVTDMWNCTIVNNTDDGVRNIQNSKMTLTNSILANNGTYGVRLLGGTVNHTYNLFFNNTRGDYYGTSQGAGEFNADPLFLCSSSYYPGDESPAIDAGIDASDVLDDDLDGRPRPIGLAWDMGCYEGSGLIGHWKLDETTDKTAADASGNALDGTYSNGPTLGAKSNSSNLGTAVTFDGIDDAVDLPEIDADFSTGFSVTFWVKPSDTPSAYGFYGFVDLSNGAGVDEVWLGWVGGAVGFQLYMTDNADGSSLRTIEDNQGFDEGKWVHCAATVDAAGNATLYRDGVVTKSGFNTSLPTNALRTQNSIGASPLKDFFPGVLDDVRIYNRALCIEQISTIHSHGKPTGIRILKWQEVR